MADTGNTPPIFISIDRGGTFTDVYARSGDRIYTEKLLSVDPANYTDATSEGISRIIEQVSGRPVAPGEIPAESIREIRMGTTVATNALLERKGTACALAITRGFGDLLRIGYQNRPDLFALNITRPEQVYSRIIEIDERIRPLPANEKEGKNRILRGASGEPYRVLKEPDPAAVRARLQEVLDSGIRSLAVVLMHGYSCPVHEQLVGEIAEELGFTHISLSHVIMPRIRIVARGDTTCVDAYLTPHITAYLNDFSTGFAKEPSSSFPLYFMQSDGGLTDAANFRGCNAILSGPAGGVVGYAATTRAEMGNRPVIGFDMGGTSTDVSRFDNDFELTHETETAGVRIQAPQLAIRTVAAGGGSRLFYRNGIFAVGPESSGAHPGPVCYRKDGHLSVTDANLFLGRLHAGFFPHIFGPDENLPLDRRKTAAEFERMTRAINRDMSTAGRPQLTPEEVALGFLDVANEVMVRPIREISVMRGFDIKEHILACFGGAGGQHGVAIARKLGINTIFIHRDAGILSALGIGAADVVLERREPAGSVALSSNWDILQKRLDTLAENALNTLAQKGHDPAAITLTGYLNLRYHGTDTQFMIARPADDDFSGSFSARHVKEFGFDLQDRTLLVDDVRIRATASLPSQLSRRQIPARPGKKSATTRCYFKKGWQDTPVYELKNLGRAQRVRGPALIIASFSTILVEPDSTAEVTDCGDLVIRLAKSSGPGMDTGVNPVHLAIFSNRFMSIAEQMGRVLQKTALSTNIKERLDFSCAIFDQEGGLVANAPHVPVHLGAMGEAVKEQIRRRGDSLAPGDVLVSNHPAAGGSHLPDITVITPVCRDGSIRFFVACRGHHSDVGGISPGSMPPFSTSLGEEGIVITSLKIIQDGVFMEKELRALLLDHPYPARDPDTVIADLKAQMAANRRGIHLLEDLINETSEAVVIAYMRHIQANAENAVRSLLREVAAKTDAAGVCVLDAEDFLDDDSPVRLRITIDVKTGDACFDFTGTGTQLPGNLNAPQAVTRSAVLYALRCLLNQEIPLNQGCLSPITILLPSESLLNPSGDAAVAGGNVLTSQRIVDVIFKAFEAAAASQGCMNNLAFGDRSFGYYETIGGGAGAGKGWHGCSGVHTHMTNTRITDPEILEQRYPVMVREFSLRAGSGGRGQYHGGDGLVRDLEFLNPMHVTILSERRIHAPYGMMGGEPGKTGQNVFITADGDRKILGGRDEIQAQSGDRIRILTPGGGGWGKEVESL